MSCLRTEGVRRGTVSSTCDLEPRKQIQLGLSTDPLKEIVTAFAAGKPHLLGRVRWPRAPLRERPGRAAPTPITEAPEGTLSIESVWDKQ